MRFFFTANNWTQLNALEELGVKNVLISYKYLKNHVEKVIDKFDRVILIPGKVDNIDNYYEYTGKVIPKLWLATQYDVPMDMELTIKYFNKSRNMKAHVVPILTQNYLNHLSRLKLYEEQVVCLGKMESRIDEDEQIKRLPKTYRYHGMAKGRLINSLNIISIDSSAWLSGVRGRKTDVFDSTPKPQVTFGEKGRSDLSSLQKYLVSHKKYLERCHINPSQILKGDYNTLLKVPHIFYYIPLFEHLKILDSNYA